MYRVSKNLAKTELIITQNPCFEVYLDKISKTFTDNLLQGSSYHFQISFSRSMFLLDSNSTADVPGFVKVRKSGKKETHFNRSTILQNNWWSSLSCSSCAKRWGMLIALEYYNFDRISTNFYWSCFYARKIRPTFFFKFWLKKRLMAKFVVVIDEIKF